MLCTTGTWLLRQRWRRDHAVDAVDVDGIRVIVAFKTYLEVAIRTVEAYHHGFISTFWRILCLFQPHHNLRSLHDLQNALLCVCVHKGINVGIVFKVAIAVCVFVFVVFAVILLLFLLLLLFFFLFFFFLFFFFLLLLLVLVFLVDFLLVSLYYAGFPSSLVFWCLCVSLACGTRWRCLTVLV